MEKRTDDCLVKDLQGQINYICKGKKIIYRSWQPYWIFLQ